MVTNRGGRTCHAAIVSRELGIPAVVGTRNATVALRDGDVVTIDADAGRVSSGVVEAAAPAVQVGPERAGLPAGGDIAPLGTKLYVNLAIAERAEAAAAMPVAGVGLLRMRTTPARLHAAGKASPVALILTAIGASIEVGLAGAAVLVVAVGALVLTLPVGVHLLPRGLYRSGQMGSVSVRA